MCPCDVIPLSFYCWARNVVLCTTLPQNALSTGPPLPPKGESFDKDDDALPGYDAIDDALLENVLAIQKANPQGQSTLENPQLFHEVAAPLLVIEEEPAQPAEGEKVKPMPVYSVVNKLKTKSGSKENLDGGPDADDFGFSLSIGDDQKMDNVLQNLQESIDDLSKYDSVPPPPVPPRTYEMEELEAKSVAQPDTEKGGGTESLSGTNAKAPAASDATETAGGATPPVPEASSEIEAALFALKNFSSVPKNPYEEVDLVIPESGGSKDNLSFEPHEML